MSLWRDTRANMAVLFAMGFAISALVSAVAVDGAALYHERRMIQNGVDLAALSAAGNPGDATALAQAALVEAGLLPVGPSAGLTVVTGHYDPDPAIAAADRFTPGRAPLNAVAVHFQRRGALYFARGWAEPPELGAMAIASVTPQVSFSLDSRLASLKGGIANGVLNALLGTNVALDVMDYQNLLAAKVDTFAFLDALAGQLGVTVGTYDDLLALEADHGKLAGALASLLTGVERTAMLKLAGAAGHNGSVKLAKLFDLGALGGLAIGSGNGEGLFTAISALDLLTASAGLGNGDRQVSLALTAGIPGLVSLDAQLAIGEPVQGGAWFAIGGVGSVVRTAQLRLRVVAEILGSGVLVGAPIRLPLYLEMAQPEAVVGAASCPSGAGGKGSATILTRPGVLRLMIGEVDDVRFGDFNTTPVVAPAKLAEVKLLGLTVLKVLASSLVEIAQTTPVALGFSSSDIARGVIRTARTTTMVSSLTGSLLGNMVLDVPVLGLGLNLSGLTGLLNTILTPLTPVLDLTLARLLEPLGLALGEADVRVYGVRCSHPVLVG
ncbi:TadG family pilus assembly protein [Devosia ginsengisoli]|uniref:Uncharacterized protein n=1 Tax=Devosia ginsengisoli TaxID=400770 RepID=A0A5B8LVX2_9HYPH|nr:TadG family pilus assembly protein [Devosia ginsengisoli]QDZ12293.1 hypothetical protein FPZ08_16985 [Devosia ginsengisoli]